MAAVAFDMLKFARTLREKANWTPGQAKGVARAFADATSEPIVTKADLREEIAPLKSELLGIKWMMGFVLALLVAIFAKAYIH
jgi:hypothetical protein